MHEDSKFENSNIGEFEEIRLKALKGILSWGDKSKTCEFSWAHVGRCENFRRKSLFGEWWMCAHAIVPSSFASDRVKLDFEVFLTLYSRIQLDCIMCILKNTKHFTIWHTHTHTLTYLEQISTQSLSLSHSLFPPLRHADTLCIE